MRRAMLPLATAALSMLGCTPRVERASLCDAVALAQWTKGDFDRFFGGDSTAGLQPTYVPTNGHLMVTYSGNGVDYDNVFVGTDPTARLISLGISVKNGLASPDDMLRATGLDGGTLTARNAWIERYSGVGPYTEVTVQRNRPEEPWVRVIADIAVPTVETPQPVGSARVRTWRDAAMAEALSLAEERVKQQLAPLTAVCSEGSVEQSKVDAGWAICAGRVRVQDDPVPHLWSCYMMYDARTSTWSCMGLEVL